MEQSYKEKYEQALAKAKEQYNYPCMRSCMGILEDLFPELKESEDEKIRKEIVRFIQMEVEDEIVGNKWLAWLGKQGEHANFRNKIQVGDKVTRNENGVLVNLTQLNRVAKPEGNKGNLGGISANPEWSEEDESILQGIWDEILANKHDAKECEWKTYDKFLNWLKSLKGRVGCEANCTTTKEWSEEDEQHVDSLLKRLDALCRNKFERTRFAISEDKDWLKSLKGRVKPQWKPSDEQMDALYKASKNEYLKADQYDVLSELWNNLKKLKE